VKRRRNFIGWTLLLVLKRIEVPQIGFAPSSRVERRNLTLASVGLCGVRAAGIKYYVVTLDSMPAPDPVQDVDQLAEFAEPDAHALPGRDPRLIAEKGFGRRWRRPRIGLAWEPGVAGKALVLELEASVVVG
jgi:hypothetical protein